MTQKNNLGVAATPRELEAALRESEQRLRWLASIVESSDDAIVSKNLDGVITSWNSGAERIFGYSASEAIGQPITLVIPQDRQSEERLILTRIQRGERIYHFETIRQHKRGSSIVVSLTVSPVKDANEKIVGASKIARQIGDKVPTIEQCKTYASEYKALGKDQRNSARRSSVFLNISRSWTALAHQLENLAVIAKDEKT